MPIDRDCHQWYDEAVRCYLEKHQGCPWCGESHCVSRSMRRGQQTYCCQKCDFQASFDHSTGAYAHIVGEDPAVEAAVNPA